MKTTIQLLVSCIALSMTACQGDKGDVGPTGLQGVAGKDGAVGTVGVKGDPGATGPKGDQGAAKVVYTPWKSMALDALPIPIFGDYILFGNVTKTEPAFTKEAMNQGVVLTYLKVNARTFNQSTNAYELTENITGVGNVLTFFKIPGRTQNRLEDYQPMQVFYDNTARRENYFEPLLYFFKRVNFSNGAFVPELQNLTNDQCRSFAKDIPQYRHVVIYGSTKARMANIDLKDYAAVKTALNLPD
jgi:Collagen triple helix repeat (20 copies)